MKSKIPLGSVMLVSVLCLFMAVFPSDLAAQGSSPGSSFVFPRFVFCNTLNSGVAIVNPNAWDATVSLTLTMSDGSASTVSTITAPGHGQVAKAASELFGDVCVDAWLQATSSATGLIAYYQTFNTQLTFMDGTDGSTTSMDLIFPVVPRSAEGEAEVDFLNQNSRPTAVDLSLWSLSGALLGKTRVQIPAQGVYWNLVENVFPPGTDLSNASHLTASAKPVNLFSQAQTISGTGIMVGFTSVPASSGNIDIAAVNALSLDQASNSGVLPYFRTGNQYSTTISIANMEPAAVAVTLTAIANDGSSLGTQRVNIPANGGLRAPVQNVFPSIGTANQEGWILISATGRVFALALHGPTNSPALSTVMMQKTPVSGFAFPQVLQGNGYSSELTLVNPSSTSASVQVFVTNPDGTTAASNQLTVPANARIRQTLNQIMPEVTQQSGGCVYVQGSPLFSNLSIAADNNATVANFAPGLVSVGYSPAPLTSFAVTGKVTLNDHPAAGFRVVLSGPTAKVTTSASDGTYVFKGLQSGSYSMTVDQYGFQFIPAQTNFDLTTWSKRQDFQGYTGQNSILVQPSSMPVGSQDTVATVFGLNFSSSSQAYAGPARLNTTFVDSSQLQIVIPTYMMAAASQYDITVATNGVTSSPYPFVAYVDRPQITAIATSGNIAEGTAGGMITLTGTGFLQGAQVKVNGLTNDIQVTLVDSTRILAYVPGAYLQHGGIYPVTVVNPYPANIESNIQLLTVFYPAPGIDAVLPGTLTAKLEPGAAPVNLDILGYGFRRGAVVLFNGKQMTTTYCENDAYCLAVHIYAKVPASELANSGFASVQVQNPSPALGTSQTIMVPIMGLAPTIESILPGTATLLNLPVKFIEPIVVTGTNFGPQTQIRIYKASDLPPDFEDPTSVLSSTQLTKNLEVTYASLGEWKVEITNPGPGGGITPAVSFFLTDGTFSGNPFIVSMNPTMVAAGGPGFTLTINGTNFENGAQVQFNMAMLNATVLSGTQITVDIPAILIEAAGRVPIRVINPDTGGASNRLYLDIR